MRRVLFVFSFYGRTRRTIYGLFCLATIPVFAAFAASGSIVFVQTYGDKGTKADADFAKVLASLAAMHQVLVWIAVVAGIVWFVMCVAWIPLSVRRLHDMAGSGWITIAFVLLVLVFSLPGYLLICLVLSVWPGTNGTNRYGRDPRRPDDIANVFGGPVGRPEIGT